MTLQIIKINYWMFQILIDHLDLYISTKVFEKAKNNK